MTPSEILYVLAFTAEEFEAALERGAALARTATAPSSAAPEPLLTGKQISEVTGIPGPWFLEQARLGSDPSHKARKIHAFSAFRGRPAWGRDAADRAGGRMGPEEGQASRGRGAVTSASRGSAWTTCPGCGWAGGPFGYSIREVWIRSLFGPPYLMILPICPVCGARVPRR